MMTRFVVSFAALALALGCAASPKIPIRAAVAEPPRLVHGGDLTADELAKLDAIYEAPMTLREARAAVDAILTRHPNAGRAHQAAAHLAELADDGHEAWRHFWQAAQDLDVDDAAFDLMEIDDRLSRGEAEATLALCHLLRTTHPRPSVRSEAAAYEARLLLSLGRVDEVAPLVRARGVLSSFQVLGPFDNESGKGFRTPFPPESGIDLARPVDGVRVKVNWRPLPRASWLGSALFGETLWPTSPAVGYLVTWIRAPHATKAFLRISSESPTRAWLNDGLVMSEEQLRGGTDDNLVAPVALAAGWNQLLVKSAQGDEDWWLRARFTDAEGVSLPGLEESATPRPYQPVPASDTAPALETVPPFLARLPEGGRKAFLVGRWLGNAGHFRAAMTAVQGYVDEHPDNLLALLTAASTAWMNAEAGKAIDLLNRAVAGPGREAPAFLAMRGRYYLQRQLFDKAQSDFLQQASAQPASKQARLSLAELFERRGWTVDACLTLEEAARQWPDDAEVITRHAQCQRDRGDVTQALEGLALAHRLAPGDATPLRALFQHALAARRFSEARQWWAKLELLEPAAPAQRLRAATLARHEGRPFAEQERLYREASALCPTCAAPFEELGDLAWEQGHKEEALAAWRAARDRDPNDTALAQRIEFHAPTRLGFIERFVPHEDDIARALLRPFKPEPGAQIARMLDHEVTEVNADGSAKRVVTIVAQALNEHGRDALIEQHLPRGGDLKILQAYSLSKDGTRQEASSIRGGDVRFRALEVGSKVVVQYVHYQASSHFLENHFVASWYFRAPNAQEEDARWILVMPKDRLLKVHVDGEVTVSEAIEGDRRIRTFTSPRSGPLLPEAHAPPFDDVLWSVHVSTVPDWEDYVRWERALLVDAFQDSARLKDLSDKLTAGLDSPRSKLDRLYQHVSKEIRYQQDYENTVAGVRPHAGPVVLERGYGDCKDKAVLLIQLGKLAGLKLKFALLRTTAAGRLRPDVPNQQFNHAIVYVPAQGDIREPEFLDPTSDGLDLGSLPNTDQGATALVLDPDGGQWELLPIPFQDQRHNYAHVTLSVNVRAPDDVTVEEQMVSRGYQASALRHVGRNPEVAERMLQSYVSQKLPGTRLIDAVWPSSEDTSQPFALTLRIDGAHALQEDADALTFHLPNTFRLGELVTLDQRALPLDLGIPQELTHTLVLTVGPGLSFAHKPAPLRVSHPCFDLERRVTAHGDKLTVTDEYHVTCHLLPSADYPVFRDKIRDAYARLRDDVKLTKVARASAVAGKSSGATAKDREATPAK